MENNTDIIIFTLLLLVLFLFFAIGTYREFVRMEKERFNSETEKGGVTNLIKFFSKIFNS